MKYVQRMFMRHVICQLQYSSIKIIICCNFKFCRWHYENVSLMEAVELSATCRLCKNIFTDPHILHCSHTFCFSCLEKQAITFQNRSVQSSPLACIECQQQWTIPESGIEFLTRNNCINSLACALKSQLPKSLPLPNCIYHSEMEVTHLCNYCSALICNICCLDKHKLHNLQPIAEAAEKFRKSITLLKEEAKNLKNIVLQQIDRVKDHISNEIMEERCKYNKIADDAEKKVKDRYNKMMKAIADYRVRAERKIIRKEHILVNMMKINEVEKLQAEVSNIEIRCDKSLETMTEMFAFWKENDSLINTLTIYKNRLKEPSNELNKVNGKKFACKVKVSPVVIEPIVSSDATISFNAKLPPQFTVQDEVLINVLSLYKTCL